LIEFCHYEVQAMERLKIVLAVAALLATAHASPGQQLPVDASSHPSGLKAQPSYVVIGDVENFNYFPLSGKTTVRQAVLQAGLLSDTVSVSVVRASQDRALWTQMISSASTDSGELVLNGDLLVVQSLQPVVTQVRKNAALRTDAGVTVVALADELIAVGDVLLQTNHQPTPEQRLTISCRFQGRTPVARATLADEVAHGDVLTLSRANRSGLKGFGSLVPVFSEWQESASTTSLPPATSNSNPFQFADPGVHPEWNSPGLLMPMPASVAESEDHAFETDMSPSDPFVDASVADIDTPPSVRLVSQTGPTSDSDGPIVAPPPPIEYPELADSVDMATASAQMSPWNLILIVGLLVAGTLILAASLRAEGEPELVELQAKVRQSQQIVAPAAADQVNTLSPADIADQTAAPATLTPTPISPTAVSFADIVSQTSEAAPQETAHTNVIPSSLVSLNEWYGKDWLSTATKPATSIPEPSRESQQPEKPQIDEKLLNIPEHTSDVPMSGFTDLEDLLLNRLPIDLCTTRLPLRVALYGRPAGPRRLRIDAAHDSLAAPHMIRSAERKRDKASLASASSAGAEDNDSQVADGLNRALHHLQERTDHDLRD